MRKNDYMNHVRLIVETEFARNSHGMQTAEQLYWLVARKMNEDSVSSDMEEVDPARFADEQVFFDRFKTSDKTDFALAKEYFASFHTLFSGEDEMLEDVVFDPIIEILRA